MTTEENPTEELVETDFLADLFSRQGNRTAGYDTVWYLELHGATVVEPTAFEPDPTTFRGSHYYNVITNTLYKKVITYKESGIVVAHWKKVSD